MKEIDYSKIRKVEIEHELYKESTKVVCGVKNYINTINYFVENNVKIISIRFYE